MKHLASAGRVIVVGGGVAGLATALRLAPLPVTVLAAAPLGEGSSTALAQGGIAAAIGDDDHPDLHAADSCIAGAGLTDRGLAARVAAAGPACIEWLASLGVNFDAQGGRLSLGLEAAHSRRRIVHAGGDATGAALLSTLMHRARETPSIEIVTNARVTELVTGTNGIVGVACMVAQKDGATRLETLPAMAVVLATGGVGGLYRYTTNPLENLGSGLVLAAHAGAVLRDLEFVQFHPTAIDAGLDPMPLATEALRGEGATLVNGRGERFMEDFAGAELAARDVVARAIFAQISAGQRVFLDLRTKPGARLRARFPAVAALCEKAGIDPTVDLVPVRPAAHYHMGGIAVDGRGRSSVANLWACGEVASTGLHGANRLASNSLLEALAFAEWIAQDIAGCAVRQDRAGRVALSPGHPGDDKRAAQSALSEIRSLMDLKVGVVRDAAGLSEAVDRLRELALDGAVELPRHVRDAALAALLVATSAYGRAESRGAHLRRENRSPAIGAGMHSQTTLAQSLACAEMIGTGLPLNKRVA